MLSVSVPLSSLVIHTARRMGLVPICLSIFFIMAHGPRVEHTSYYTVRHALLGSE